MNYGKMNADGEKGNTVKIGKQRLKGILRNTSRLSVDPEKKYKVLLDSPGEVSEIRLAVLPDMKTGDNEVKIEVYAFSLNFGDLLCVKGLYPTMPDYPFTPGFEVSGKIIETGRNVSRFKKGDSVIAVMSHDLGGHSQIVVSDERFVVKKPDSVTYEEACSFPVAFITVHHVFRKALPRKNETILIHTATGGVGLIAVQYAKKCGLNIIATVGSEEKINYLKGIGVENCINYLVSDFKEEVLKLTNGRGVDIIINTLSGEAISRNMDILAPGGRYMEIAMTALKSLKSFDISRLNDNQTFFSIDVRKLYKIAPELINEYLEDMYDFLEKREIVPTVGKVYDLTNIKEAFYALENRANIGKVVVNARIAAHEKRSVSLIRMPAAESNNRALNEEIAVIGMSCRLPGAENADEYWDNLKNGVNCIGDLPYDRWGLSPEDCGELRCHYGGFLENVGDFDPLFFNMSGMEAEMADPQQRILLEQMWSALEDAGCSAEYMSGRKCGVFVGVGQGDYQSYIKERGGEINAQSFIGNSSSVSAARISYFLNLKGPCISIDTACSSSLVAVELACRSLRNGESEIGLAGGAFISMTPHFYMQTERSGMLSPDGRCKTFDNSANGFVPGEGVSVLVLKRLSDAIRDNDHIYGVIAGNGINQDGKTNGITAPSTLSQTELEADVYNKFGIDPEKISYIEAHGTGTKLGDPIEVEALTNSFSRFTDKKNFCAIGSCKTNIGHTVMSAGIASVIKVLQSMKHGMIPPSINYDTPNEHINFNDSPFYVADKLMDWQGGADAPRYAAVSSFGFSGTNAHIVLKDAPAASAAVNKLPVYIIVLSAKNQASLCKKYEELYSWISDEGNDSSIQDISYTLLCGRTHFTERCAFTVRNRDELIEKLKALAVGNYAEGVYLSADNKAHNADLNKITEMLADVRAVRTYTEGAEKLAAAYADGETIDFAGIFEGTGRKISMPAYPFSRRTYLYGYDEKKQSIKTSPGIKADDGLKYEIIRKADSTECRVSLSPGLTVVRDHVVFGQYIVSAAFQTELILSSVRKIGVICNCCIKDIMLLKPVICAEDGTEIRIVFSRDENRIKVRITDDEDKVFTIGNIAPGTNQFRSKKMDIRAVKAQMTRKEAPLSIWKLFENGGVCYGNAYKGLKSVDHNNTMEICAIESVKTGMVHNPYVFDSALQGTSVFYKSADGMLVPSRFSTVEFYAPVPDKAYSIAMKQNGALSICITDESGNVCSYIEGIEYREIRKNDTSDESEDKSYDEMFFMPVWEKVQTGRSINKYSNTLFLCFRKMHKSAVSIADRVCSDHTVIDIEDIITKGRIDIDRLLKAADIASFDSIFMLLVNNNLPTDIKDISVGQCRRSIELLHGLMKKLCGLGLDSKKIVWRIITNNSFNVSEDELIDPTFSPIHGIAATASDEFINWNICSFDIDITDCTKNDILSCFKEYESGGMIAVRGHVPLQRKIKRTDGIISNNCFIRNGTYMIIGGLGGIGRTLSRYLADKYKAHLILVGRKKDNEEISGFVDELKAVGGDAVYYSADAGNEADIENVILKGIKKFGQITGFIHSAIVLKDRMLRTMTDEEMNAVLWPKINGTVVPARILKRLGTEHIVFFSSAQSLFLRSGQSNYCAACMFEDSFSMFLKNNIGMDSKVFNFGFWGEAGIVANSRYRDNLRRAGLVPLTNKEGLFAIENGPFPKSGQLVVMKADDKLLSMKLTDNNNWRSEE